MYPIRHIRLFITHEDCKNNGLREKTCFLLVAASVRLGKSQADCMQQSVLLPVIRNIFLLSRCACWQLFSMTACCDASPLAPATVEQSLMVLLMLFQSKQRIFPYCIETEVAR